MHKDKITLIKKQQRYEKSYMFFVVIIFFQRIEVHGCTCYISILQFRSSQSIFNVFRLYFASRCRIRLAFSSYCLDLTKAIQLLLWKSIFDLGHKWNLFDTGQLVLSSLHPKQIGNVRKKKFNLKGKRRYSFTLSLNSIKILTFYLVQDFAMLQRYT